MSRIDDLLCPSAYAATKGNPPVAHWRFNEGGGGTAYDDVGSNDGTLNAGAGGTNTAVGQMWTRQGKIGGALECDGTDDYVDASNANFANTFTDADDFTICAWVKPVSFSADTSIVGQRYGDTMVFGHRTTGKLFLNMDDTRASSPENNTVLSSGVWQHIALVISAADSKAYIYIDGVLSGEREKGTGGDSDYGNIGVEVNYGDNLEVGASNHSADRTCLGVIDEVRVWKTARTAEEIADNMNKEIEATDANLLAYFPCNEAATSALLKDDSGNGYDLTLVEGADPNGYSFIAADWMKEEVSIKENNISKVSVFPNPVQNVLNIQGMDISNTEVNIYDVAGQLIQNSVILNSSVDVSELNTGIYFLEIDNIFMKFVKK